MEGFLVIVNNKNGNIVRSTDISKSLKANIEKKKTYWVYSWC